MPLMHLTHDERTRSAGVLRGVIGGAIAGTFFMGLAMWFSNVTGGPFYDPLILTSSLVLPTATTNTTVALAIGAAMHAALSVGFGALFGLASPLFRTERGVIGAGFAYGAALYFVNIVLLGNVTGAFESTEVFGRFGGVNGPLIFATHVLYGTILGATFVRRRSRPGEEPDAELRQREEERERVGT